MNTIENKLHVPDLQYPSLLMRVQALLIDVVLVLVIFVLSSYALRGLDDYSVGLKIFIFAFCLFLYEPTLIAFSGGTIGHKLRGLRVKRYEEPDKNLSIFSAVGRVVVKSLLGWVSFITVSFNSEKRAIHDYTAGAVVIINK